MSQANAEQLRAIEAGGGPVAIIAGPGTGKTKTLVARIQHLMATGVSPRNILALTFTKKAAEELSVRLGDKDVWVGTFHALGHQILGGNLVFATEQQRLHIIKELKKSSSMKKLTIRELGLAISKAKNTHDPTMASIIATYDAELAKLGVVDFDDLLARTTTLLQNDLAKRAEWQAAFTHILVDEFQDTNILQYELLQLLNTTNLFVIGDPLQSIYGFRGASGDIFERFKHDFPDHIEVALTINYRSTPQIVRLANDIFGGHLHAYSQAQGQVRAVQVLNEFSEANWVLDQIQQAIGGSDLQKAISNDDRLQHKTLRDFAILYRNRSVARIMQQCLEESGLPYQIVGEGSPYEDAKVQAVMAGLRFVQGDKEAVINGLTKQQLEVLLKDVSGEPVAAAIEMAQRLAYGPTKPLKQLFATLSRFKTIAEANHYLNALSDQQFYDPKAEAITLLTIHASKGLEFDTVFLLGAEEGILPSERGDIQEEKRLFYVAATRAKSRFETIHATMRHGKSATLSQFIIEQRGSILPRTQDPQLANDRRRAQKRFVKRAQTTLF